MRDGTYKFGQLIRHFLAISAGNYGAIVFALLINIILTRRLGVEEYGRLVLLLMVSQILMLFASNWTHVGFVRFGSQEFAASGTVVKTFWARVGVVGTLAAVAGVVYLLKGDSLAGYLGVPRWGIVLVFVHFLLFHLMTSLGAMFQARQEMARYGALILSDKAVALGMMLLLSGVVTFDPLTALGCYAVSCLVVSLVSLLVLGRQSLFPVSFDASSFHALLRFSIPLILSVWAGLFSANWIDYVVIKWWLSIADVGLYSLANQLSGVVQQLTIVFSTLLLPQLSVMVARGDQTGIQFYLQHVLPYWLLGISVFFCLVLLGGAPFIPLVFGEAFQGTITPFAILMLATSALALFNAFDPLISAYGATWSLMRVTLISVAVKVVLTLSLTPWMGITGVAMATVGSYLTSAVLVMELVGRHAGISVRPMVTLALPFLIVCAARSLLEGPAFYLAAFVGAAGSVYLLVRGFRLFQERDREMLKGLCSAAFNRTGRST